VLYLYFTTLRDRKHKKNPSTLLCRLRPDINNSKPLQLMGNPCYISDMFITLVLEL